MEGNYARLREMEGCSDCSKNSNRVVKASNDDDNIKH